MQITYSPVKNGYFIISCYPTPSAESTLQFIPPPHHPEPIVFFLLVKIMISLLSSEKTVYSLILLHNRIQHSSPHQYRAYYPSQKHLSHFYSSSEDIRLQFMIQYPSKEPAVGPTLSEKHQTPA